VAAFVALVLIEEKLLRDGGGGGTAIVAGKPHKGRYRQIPPGFTI